MPKPLSTHELPKAATTPIAVLLAASCLWGQSRVEDFTVHSPGLEHNLLGDPADQPVSIYLPAAYAKEPERRFAVIVFLHGYSDSTPRHQTALQLQPDIDQVIAAGGAQPVIVVFPNGINKYGGAFYANSAVDGNWDDFIVRDVIKYVDSHYRTSPERGIAGHSMGGYGALTLAFKHPDVFHSVYAMSPCCTDLIGDLGPSNGAWAEVNALTSPDQVPAALGKGQFFVAAMSAIDAALSPDPKAKTFGDAPFSPEGRIFKTNAAAYSAITSKMPVHMVAPMLGNLQRLRGIVIDYGAQDQFTHIPEGAQRLSAALTDAGVTHKLDVYQGDHSSAVRERFAKYMLPWMSEQLYPEPK